VSYTSYLSGEIAIDPPVPWSELQDSPFVRTPERKEYERLVWLRMVEETVETDEGTLIRKQAVAIRPSQAGELRAWGLDNQVQEIVTAHGEGRTFTGHILVRGEESPDLWRVRVYNGRALAERPRIIWPDGTEWEDA